MSLRIGFLGDRHLSQRSPRYAHALEVWRWAIDDALDRGASVIVGLGDVCEGAMTGEEAYQLAGLYTRITQAGARACEVLGNHEAPDALKWLRYLGVTVADDAFVTVDLGTAMLALAPYARKGRPPYDGLLDGDIATTNQAAAARLGAFARDVVQASHVPVLLAGHWTVTTMRTGAHDYEVHGAQEMIVPIAALDGVALTVVGHIHAAQDVTPTIIGAGSLYSCSFGEVADAAKSYVLATVDGGQVTWERRPVPARGMVVLRETWPSDPQSIADVAAELAAGAEVKLIVEVAEDRVAGFDPAAYDALRAVASVFVLEKRVLPIQRVRAPSLARAASLADELTVWLDTTDQDLDEARRQRLVGKLAEVEG